MSLLDLSFRTLTFPLLAAQAIRVGRTALKLPEAAGPRKGRSGTGPPLRLLIVGDSSAAGVGVDHQSDALLGQLVALLSPRFTVDWHLIAKTGDTTGDTVKALARQPLPPQDIVITALGVNDVTHAIPFARWRRSHSKLRTLIAQRCRPKHVYMSAIPPLGQFPLLPAPLRWTLGRQAQKFDQWQQLTLAADAHVHHVAFDQSLDPALMAADGFHPGPAVYAAWAKEMASRIKSDWP